MFVANSAWLLTRKRLTQIQLWSVVFQALPFHYSSEYKVGLHFLTKWRQSKHLLILGPQCLMHFSAELSETLRHWCRSVHWTFRHQCKNARHFGTKHSAEMSWVRVLGPKCPYTTGWNVEDATATRRKKTVISATYESANGFKGHRTCWIARMKVEPLDFMPNGVRTHSNKPLSHTNAVNHWWSARTGVCQYPDLTLKQLYNGLD